MGVGHAGGELDPESVRLRNVVDDASCRPAVATALDLLHCDELTQVEAAVRSALGTLCIKAQPGCCLHCLITLMSIMVTFSVTLLVLVRSSHEMFLEKQEASQWDAVFAADKHAKGQLRVRARGL